LVTGKKDYGDRFGYFKKLKGTERLQHIALVSSSDLKDLQPVLRKHRGNWIIEVASAAAWVSYGYR